MNIAFSGLDAPVKVTPGFTTTLQIENEMFFSRIVRSLSYPDGHFALEPFTLWADDNELRPSAALMFVSDVLVLPWDDRSLMGEVTKRFERWFLEDEDLRREVEEFDAVLSSKLLEMGFGMNSDFQFALEWDLKKYLKFRGFGVGIQDDATLLDNIIDFLSLALDAGCKKTIVFVNLKTFLTKNDLKTFFEHVFYSKLSVLLLENKQDNVEHDYEQKTVVDQLFLEN